MPAGGTLSPGSSAVARREVTFPAAAFGHKSAPSTPSRLSQTGVVSEKVVSSEKQQAGCPLKSKAAIDGSTSRQLRMMFPRPRKDPKFEVEMNFMAISSPVVRTFLKISHRRLNRMVCLRRLSAAPWRLALDPPSPPGRDKDVFFGCSAGCFLRE